ncbi:MAG: hypothetical protein IPH04_04525 [Saprospirales bacterium]|nr:hypothetical protein [Saprospirales bacterium]
MTPAEILKSVIEQQTPRIRESFSGPSYHAIQHIVRRLDVISQFYPNSNADSVDKIQETQEFFNLVGQMLSNHFTLTLTLMSSGHSL